MANISAEVVENRIREFGKLWMIDDLIRQRGKDENQVPILGYPRFEDNAGIYEFFTGKEVDRMVDETCRVLQAAGLAMNSHKTVALFAPSDLSFVVTFFALFRLGCKVLTMSIRLSEPSCLKLLENTGCDTILHGSTTRISATIQDIRKTRDSIRLIPIPARKDFDKPGRPSEPFVRPIPDKETEHAELALMAHSSGSTGLPKPLALSHRSVLNNLFSGTGCKAFNALPWYHLHGLFTSTQAMYMRKTAHLFNASLPLTAHHLVSALKAIQPEICHTVPYALKLMAETKDGIEVLKRCKFVTAAGARTPDELGDRLVREGVNLGVILGLTEVGHVGDSIYREPGDDSWLYIRPYASLREHMFFKKLNEGVYESVYLKSHPALMPVTSNSNDPPGSFHSRDLFTPHPTIEHAWKFVARDDDRITLLSGEKILPLAMEGAVREDALVRDALMVGLDRLQPGLLVFRSANAGDISDEEFVRTIWPKVETTNEIMDEFARITPDMILPIAADIEYPVTDKNNIIRAAAYARFEDLIESLYSKSAGLENAQSPQNLKLDLMALEQHVLHLVRDQVGIEVTDMNTDFFAAGVDSLRAAQIRRLLQQEIDLGGHKLTTNSVYDAGNAAQLARILLSMRTGESPDDGHTTEANGIGEMDSLITEHARFSPRPQGKQPNPTKDTALITGATGALSAHILDQLLDDPHIDKVFCLVRGDDVISRLEHSLEQRGLSLVSSRQSRASKLTALRTDDLGAANLGLSPDIYSGLRDATTLVIHAAWPVNFNISLSSFIPQIKGLRNLLDLAMDTPFQNPARVLFASSISTAFRTPAPAQIAEAPIQSLEHSAPTGYGRSKLIGEHICHAAGSSGALVGVLRVGQISADSVNGIWNEKEHVPLLVRSAAELKALPRLYGFEGRCEWMPVDTVATTFLQLADKLTSRSGGAAFYNVVPPHSFSWNDDFIPELRRTGLEVEEVDVREWLARLRARAAELGDAAEEELPAIKLSDYYEHTYLTLQSDSGLGLRFQVDKACADSEALRTCPQLSEAGIVRKMLEYWLRREAFTSK
ncbi:acetyl-CoA synthetase-like protein [Xylariaceae sp. FL0016]|nr:acetyl-CoA synthetase-like protein [Xylariaceae sp. FL0016]